MRAFVAIDLPDGLRPALTRLQAALPVGRPVPPENLHLTLAFLGERPMPQIEAAHEALERIRSAGFDLTLTGLDVFGNAAPRVLYAGVAASDPLRGLRKRVRGALHGAGIALARERFRPHVTLARFPHGMDVHDLERLRRFLSVNAAFTLPPFPVTAFALHRSTLRPDGAVHEELARYALI